jgi:cytochrome oxidase Cu insertion factor (SCO1/SenC/PrrC family)
MSKKNQYVVPNGTGWAVRGENNSRVTARFETQRAAIERGRKIAMNHGAELRIQGTDGKFREAWSYGNDPYPPKG